MSFESVQAFFKHKAPDIQVIALSTSTPTVALAAQAHGVEPGQIAKTLSFRVGDGSLLVVASGDVRLDNKKLRQVFGAKAKMLDAETTQMLTGHPIGGVCPFGLATDMPVYCDVSLLAYETVLPAAGSVNSAVQISPKRLAELVGAKWVDVGKSAEQVVEQAAG